jgi:hypothetical protein
MGIGGVCHTLNPRLSDADISYIADHGQDKVILVDLTFLPIIGRIWQQLPQVKAFVVLTDRCVVCLLSCSLKWLETFSGLNGQVCGVLTVGNWHAQ